MDLALIRSSSNHNPDLACNLQTRLLYYPNIDLDLAQIDWAQLTLCERAYQNRSSVNAKIEQ